MRHGYSYYAAASLRWFFRTDEKRPEEFVTGVAEENWNACERTMAAQTEERIAVLREVYCSRDGMSETVARAAEHAGLEPEDVWAIVGQTEKRFAKERGLV